MAVNGDNESSEQPTELASLTHDERRVLAVLVAVRGASLSDDQIASCGDVEEVMSALAALKRRGLVREDERGRHAVPAEVLERLRGALDVVDTADRVLRQLIAIAEDGRLTLDDLDAVLGITRWAADAGRLPELLRLVQAVEEALSFTRRVEAWLVLVRRAREAARELGDRDAEAWSDEQLRACEQSSARAEPATRAGQADGTAVLRRSDERPPRPSLMRIGLATVAAAAAGLAGFAVASAVQDDHGGEAGSTTVTLPGQTVTAAGDTLTLPSSTVTVGGETVTLPGATVTVPGETVTLPNDTVTLPGTTVATTVFVTAVP